MATEHRYGVAVVSGRPTPCAAHRCWATSTHASMAVTKVYLTPRSHSGSARRSAEASASPRSAARSSDTDRSRRSRRVSSTAAHRFGVLPVAATKTWQLVGVDLPRPGQPAHPCRPVVVEQQPPAESDSAGELERGVVQHEQVDAGWQQDLRRPAAGRSPTRPRRRGRSRPGRSRPPDCRAGRRTEPRLSAAAPRPAPLGGPPRQRSWRRVWHAPTKAGRGRGAQPGSRSTRACSHLRVCSAQRSARCSPSSR